MIRHNLTFWAPPFPVLHGVEILGYKMSDVNLEQNFFLHQKKILKMNIIYINIMNSNRVVPYLARVNSCEGTRQKPELLYVTRGGKKNSLIFHTKENGKFFQYRQKSVNKKSIVLMCIYKENSRSDNCNAFITVKPNREGLIISKMGKRKNRFYINYEEKISENSFSDWTIIYIIKNLKS